MSDWTVEELEDIVLTCVQRGDTEGIRAALTVMATKDPRRAEELLDVMRAGLVVRRDMRRKAGRP